MARLQAENKARIDATQGSTLLKPNTHITCVVFLIIKYFILTI
jgi:hypothetical protein